MTPSGFIADGFDELGRAFERSFAAHDEIGAAVAADGRGRLGRNDSRPWAEDTMVVCTQPRRAWLR